LEELSLDARYAGAFPGAHPMSLARAELRRRGILCSADVRAVEAGARVTIAGLVITRQRPGEGKIIYVTLEDETGHTDVAISEGAFKRFQDVIRLSGALIVQGTVEADGDARNVRAFHAAPLELQAALDVPSHDFH
jgi:error-prone DNA polymerase